MREAVVNVGNRIKNDLYKIQMIYLKYMEGEKFISQHPLK